MITLIDDICRRYVNNIYHNNDVIDIVVGYQLGWARWIDRW